MSCSLKAICWVVVKDETTEELGVVTLDEDPGQDARYVATVEGRWSELGEKEFDGLQDAIDYIVSKS